MKILGICKRIQRIIHFSNSLVPLAPAAGSWHDVILKTEVTYFCSAQTQIFSPLSINIFNSSILAFIIISCFIFVYYRIADWLGSRAWVPSHSLATTILMRWFVHSLNCSNCCNSNFFYTHHHHLISFKLS